MSKIKICIVVTDSSSLWSLYRGQFMYLKENGFDITAIASSGKEHELLRSQGIKTVVIDMERGPSAIKDFFSFINLFKFFLSNRFDVVSVSTPKASFLGVLAARLALQRKVSYILRGRVYENYEGLKRWFYESIDRVVSFLSSSIFSISHELRQEFIDKGFCNEKKIFVIGSGSSNGVDLGRFTLSNELKKSGDEYREKYGLTQKDVLYMYSGRIRKDKGVTELVSAFKNLSNTYSNVYLLIQGKVENIDPLPDDILYEIENHPKIILEGWGFDIEKYYAAADIFVFPSHREGFGNVAIEASAMELPVIAFDVVGCRESVENNVSGIIVDDVSSNSLYMAMKSLLINKQLREQLGIKGRLRVEEKFDSQYIWSELAKYYKRLATVAE